jgi:two-component system sensor histidine kinase VicK
MHDKQTIFLSKTIAVIKKIILTIFAITTISLTIVAIGVGGQWVISNVTIGMAWVVAFSVGTLIFLLWEGVAIKLKKTDKLKSEFVTIAAHRIRTPLTRIRWMISEVASENGLGKNNPLISSLDETMDNLINATNKLLSAAEAGKSSLYYDYLFETGHFDTVVRQVVARYSIGAAQKNINVDVDIAEGLPETSFDKERMRTAIGAFVENAILYTDKGGTIYIKVYIEKKNIIFSIKDNGIGIPKEDLPYIFSKFFRSKDAVSLDRDRAGLGLFIAKEIIRKHKGKVGVESEGRNTGSRFWVSLPLR